MSYKTIAELYQEAADTGKQPWQVIVCNEAELTGRTEEEILQMTALRYGTMRESALRMLEGGDSHDRRTLISGMAERQHLYGRNMKADEDGSILTGAAFPICGRLVNEAMARALSASETNAAMGKICAAPTAGSCGVLPAVLTTLQEEYHLEETVMTEALLLASGIGAVITRNATVSGAAGGCQAECGTAAAMASAAAVFLRGGSHEQQQGALSFSLINCMGLICDPVAGLVQIPCAQRNASQAVNALLSADMAMAGQVCMIPADEVIEAMYRTGKLMSPLLKETAEGGIAATETGRRIAAEYYHE